MHRNMIVLLLSLVASVGACGGLTSPSTPIATQDIRLTPAEDSILALQAAWVQTALRGEVEASAALMSDNFRFVAPKGLVFTKQQWAETSRAQHQQPYDSVTYAHVHVHLLGDYAFVSGEYTQRTTAVGQKLRGTGVFTSAWVREGNAWRLIASVYPGPAQRP